MLEYVDLENMIVPYPTNRRKKDYRVMIEQVKPGQSISIYFRQSRPQYIRKWAVHIARWRGVVLNVNYDRARQVTTVSCSMPDDGRLPTCHRLSRVVRLGLDRAMEIEDMMED